jgi:hypothetical protein
VSVNRLLAQHKNAENNLADLGRGLDVLQEQGQQLVDEQIPGTGPVPLRLAETRAYYDHLKKLADERRRELEGAVEYYQVRRAICSFSPNNGNNRGSLKGLHLVFCLN